MNILKRIACLFLPAVAVVMVSCKAMDHEYEQFVKDGPINYITKLNIDDVQIIGERYRVHITWPAQKDLRGTKALITWANGTQRMEKELDPAQTTDFFVAEQAGVDENGEETLVPLPEGTYIFEITLFDGEGNSSLKLTKTGTVYGDMWAAYQPNRGIVGNAMQDGGLVISFDNYIEKPDSPTLVETTFEWRQDGQNKTHVVPATSNRGEMENFNALSFRYRTSYIPEKGGSDKLYSPWAYYGLNVSQATIKSAFQEEELVNNGIKKFIFPAVNDPHVAGYEFRWIDEDTGSTTIQRTETNEITLQGCNTLRVYVRTVFKYGDVEFTSLSEETFDMMQLTDVNYDRAAWTATTTTHSGYLYAHDGSTGKPEHMFDGSTTTYLSFVKPGGSSSGTLADGTTATQTPPLGTVPYFTVDMGQKQEVNRFFWRHRTGNNVQLLRAFGVRLAGSTDGVNFETILPRNPYLDVTETIHPSDTDQTPNAHEIFWIPTTSTYNVTGNSGTADSNTYEIFMKEAKEYRYIRVYLTVHARNYGAGGSGNGTSARGRYERADAPAATPNINSNALQIAEFGLGLYIYR